jgi:hypothetical protein
LSALPPIENRNIRGVLGDRYPLNSKCAHPECDKDVESAHHIFGRPPPQGRSWFVEIEGEGKHVIPHVVGLCGSGTTGHHGDVEEHRAWIKYEDGEFVWYDRIKRELDPGIDRLIDEWEVVGPLDPQPAMGEKSRRRKRRLKGDAKRKKINVTVKVPNEEQEDGAGLLYDAIEQLEEILGHDPKRSMYYTIMDGLNIAILHGRMDA